MSTAVARLLVTVMFLSIVPAASCGRRGDTAAPASYTEEIEDWRARRIERLRSPTGYLALVGLYWLEEGENTFGAAANNDLVFPEGAPESAGAFYLSDGATSVKVREGVELMHDGAVVESMRLYHDQDVDHERTILELGTLDFWVIKRGDQIGVRVRDPESPLRQRFKGVESYDIDPRWRIEAVIELNDPPLFIPIANEVGIVTREPSLGTLVFEINGETHRLDALGEPGDESLFVIFADQTNGTETYGGGRFVYTAAPDEDGKVVLDFNKAYNPPCAFSNYTTCPLPPPQNQLPLRITAGEKGYSKDDL